MPEIVDPTGSGSALPPAMSTSERIIEASIHLFNDLGYVNVPALKIASHLNISPGHLAYHFKKKTDIVDAIFPRIEQSLLDVLRTPRGPISPEAAARYQIGIFRTLWRFRFFFNALTTLLRREEDRRRRYLQFQDGVISTLTNLLDELIGQKHMRAVAPPNTTRLVATNLWMLWLSWLRFEQIAAPETPMVEDAAIYDGALHHFSLLQPYYGKAFAAELLTELRRALPPV